MSQAPTSSTHPSMAPGPLFVVSMWRSGSSLLYALLNKHPQVGLMYEADLVLLRSVFLKPPPMRDWAERWQFWNQAFTRHGLDVSEFSQNRGGFRNAFELVHQEYARRKGATIWGDKSPNYYDRLREMAEVFPAARFIIVWRDPLGTANSILRAGHLGNSYFRRKGSMLRGLFGNEVFRREYDWLRGHGKPVLEVNYEELAADPALVMRDVCRFVEVPYDDALATLKGADRSAIYEGKHHALVKGNEIVFGPRVNVVNDSVRAKIDRYVQRWRRHEHSCWPAFHTFEGLEVEPAGDLERSKDKLSYYALRAYDAFTAFCFCAAPLKRLRSYRKRKYRRPAEPTEAVTHVPHGEKAGCSR